MDPFSTPTSNLSVRDPILMEFEEGVKNAGKICAETVALYRLRIFNDMMSQGEDLDEWTLQYKLTTAQGLTSVPA